MRLALTDAGETRAKMVAKKYILPRAWPSIPRAITRYILIYFNRNDKRRQQCEVEVEKWVRARKRGWKRDRMTDDWWYEFQKQDNGLNKWEQEQDFQIRLIFLITANTNKFQEEILVLYLFHLKYNCNWMHTLNCLVFTNYKCMILFNSILFLVH